ncbi:hypothetical protein H206_05230 [Candidatus Electrothrix aarhusensis]|uniref:Uncharacterized protein n=1 Tax=Candidatus Electrothrix aarhusensis TaxID=1859131 RepID=A0A3S3R200_9BACT|nr:hypothetical protein H206_05230 [Candidatus Electrothrix aarhusensis]
MPEKRFAALLAEKGKGTQDLKIALQGQEEIFLPELGTVVGKQSRQGVEIVVKQFFLNQVGQCGIGINEQGGKVVGQRTEAACLIIDKTDPALLDHDVAALEIPMKKEGGVCLGRLVCQRLKILRYFFFVNLQLEKITAQGSEKIAGFLFQHQNAVVLWYIPAPGWLEAWQPRTCIRANSLTVCRYSWMSCSESLPFSSIRSCNR